MSFSNTGVRKHRKAQGMANTLRKATGSDVLVAELAANAEASFKRMSKGFNEERALRKTAGCR